MLNNKEYDELFTEIFVVAGIGCLILGVVGFGLWKLITHFMH